MATHSSILVWIIPWTEVGYIQSIWSQRVEYNSSNLGYMHILFRKKSL